MKAVCFSILVLLTGLASGCRKEATPKAPANVLLVTLDTLRADRLGCYGYALAETPHLDRLAAEGARFDQALSQVPLTLPSHSTILTGLFPMGHGVRDNGTYRLSGEEVTVAEILKERGYDTAAFVSSFVVDSRFGLAQGFDTYFDFDDEPGASREAMRGLSGVQRVGGETASRAIEWLRHERSKPFFVWVHLYDPHSPYEAPEPYGSRFADRPYDGEVAYTDSIVGRLLEAIPVDDTLVVVAGDHGESLGEHGEEYHSWFIYDATLRVPLIVRFPGVVRKETVIEDQVRLADIAPSVLDLLGVPDEGSPAMQGKSFASWFSGGERDPRPAYAESLVANLQFGWGKLRAIRERGFKYIKAPRPELYDLGRDPGETRNLVEERPEIARDLDGRLSRMEDDLERAGASGASQAVDAETLRKLQSLGYVASSAPAAGNEDLAAVDPKDRIEVYKDFSTGLSDAMDALDGGDPDEAIRLLEPLARSVPSHHLVHYHLGQAFFRKQSYERAAAELELALSLAPKFSQARSDLAEIYVRTGSADRAVALLNEGLSEQPENALFRFVLGFAYHRERRFDEALDAYRRARELEKTYPPLLSNMAALYLQTGRPDLGVDRLRELVTVDPSNALAWNNLGLALVQSGRLEEAGEPFQKASELDPENRRFQDNFELWKRKMAGR